jgi:hypothetical protein
MLRMRETDYRTRSELGRKTEGRRKRLKGWLERNPPPVIGSAVSMGRSEGIRGLIFQ